jgi:hypothetical protein
MPPNCEPPLRQPLPPLARADRGRLVEQPVLFLLLGQPGEPGHQRVPGWEERFLAVEDGGIGARCVVNAVELPRPQRELDASEQGRVRVGLDVGIDQVRDADDLTHCAVGSMSSLSMAGKTAQAPW